MGSKAIELERLDQHGNKNAFSAAYSAGTATRFYESFHPHHSVRVGACGRRYKSIAFVLQGLDILLPQGGALSGCQV